MKTSEIIKSNKLIAEFMGIVYKNEWESKEIKEHSFELDNVWNYSGEKHGKMNAEVSLFTEYTLGELKYHSSWDWLMPVVDKLKSVTEEPEDLDTLKDTLWWGTILDAWKVIVESIKEYNERKGS